MAATILPEIPMVNAGLYYVNGLQISNDATTPLTLLDVAAGQCRDSSNTNDIFVTSPVVINTAAKGVLGLDFGTIAASTMYAVYAIGSSVNQVGAGQPASAFPGSAILSLSFVQPVLPAGYDMFRRIGAIVTDGAAHIEEFRQTGNASQRTMRYGVGVGVVAAGHAVGYTAVSLNVNAPAVPPIATDVLLLVQITPTAAGNEVAFQPTGAGAGSIYANLSGSVAGVDQQATVTCPCNAASSISYKVTAAGDSVTYAVSGYVDVL
jgi:hypothetical protein